MSLPRFFRVTKPRQFHYEPVFYDERKERMQERTSMTEQQKGISHEGQFRRTLTRGSISSRYLGKRKTVKQSAIRLIIIFLFLLLITYLLLFI
jgi:hypothetical protein